jgi:hypothetical protein
MSCQGMLEVRDNRYIVMSWRQQITGMPRTLELTAR